MKSKFDPGRRRAFLSVRPLATLAACGGGGGGGTSGSTPTDPALDRAAQTAVDRRGSARRQPRLIL
jgi:hypothetical protein